jgi:hypothetical protein
VVKKNLRQISEWPFKKNLKSFSLRAPRSLRRREKFFNSKIRIPNHASRRISPLADSKLETLRLCG